jgi:hypothetical protein
LHCYVCSCTPSSFAFCLKLNLPETWIALFSSLFLSLSLAHLFSLFLWTCVSLFSLSFFWTAYCAVPCAFYRRPIFFLWKPSGCTSIKRECVCVCVGIERKKTQRPKNVYIPPSVCKIPKFVKYKAKREAGRIEFGVRTARQLAPVRLAARPRFCGCTSCSMRDRARVARTQRVSD